jgi:predicted DNA-binding transcriptional regulator AlpA
MVTEYKRTGLMGMKEICAYVGKSVNTVKTLIRDEGFPAVQIGGMWESDCQMIDQWRRAQIEQAVKRNDK